MKLFCKLPFSRISIDDEGNIWPACCPDWVAFPLGNIFKQSWEEIWYGADATRFRDSMYDGSLKYCKRAWCPNIADAEAGVENYHVVPLEQSPASWDKGPPIHINLNYDQTCNLKCPTCRSDYIHLNKEQLNKVEFIQNYVETQILPTVESIAVTGVGDPFISSVFRPFLLNFDAKKYPRLKTIHFHTNGLLFDEKLYEKMNGIHGLNLSIDISIDAASDAVYTKVRPPGKWKKLMKNLQFIKKLDNLQLLGISMVVQQDNYMEMMDFVRLGESLVHKKRNTFVEFKRVRQDPHLSDADFGKIGLDTLSAADKVRFVQQLHMVERKRLFNAKHRIKPDINHNMYAYLPAPLALSPYSPIEKYKAKFAAMLRTW